MITLTALILAVAAPGQEPHCTRKDRQDYARKADLPRGAAAAIKVRMAEKGATYQATDVVNQPNLPLYRFVKARRTGCALTIDYEQGGFAHRWGKFTLVERGGRW